MIGIIGAMDIEVDGIKRFLTDTSTTVVSGIEFVSGKAFGKSVVAAISGVGKVNAAICTEAMILKFSPDCIINTGVAGCLSKRLSICDIAIADNVVQYDLDTSPLGDPVGFISGINTVYIACNERIVHILENAAHYLTDTAIETGTIATGDKFVNDNILRKSIQADFNAISNEMEGGSIGHVCSVNNIKFGVLRVMSDNADSTSDMDYLTFKPLAAEKSINIIKKFIELY